MGIASSQLATQQATEGTEAEELRYRTQGASSRALPQSEILISSDMAKKVATKQATDGALGGKRRRMASGDGNEEMAATNKKKRKRSVNAGELAKLQTESREVLTRPSKTQAVEEDLSTGIKKKQRVKRTDSAMTATALLATGDRRDPAVKDGVPIVAENQGVTTPRKRTKQKKQLSKPDPNAADPASEQLLPGLDEDREAVAASQLNRSAKKANTKCGKRAQQSSEDAVAATTAPEQHAVHIKRVRTEQVPVANEAEQTAQRKKRKKPQRRSVPEVEIGPDASASQEVRNAGKDTEAINVMPSAFLEDADGNEDRTRTRKKATRHTTRNGATAAEVSAAERDCSFRTDANIEAPKAEPAESVKPKKRKRPTGRPSGFDFSTAIAAQPTPSKSAEPEVPETEIRPGLSREKCTYEDAESGSPGPPTFNGAVVNRVGQPGLRRRKKSNSKLQQQETDSKPVTEGMAYQVQAAPVAEQRPGHVKHEEGQAGVSSKPKRKKHAAAVKNRKSSAHSPETDALSNSVLTASTSPPHAHVDYGVDATEQVKHWLGSHEPSADAAAAAKPLSGKRTKKKGKRVSQDHGSDDSEYEDVGSKAKDSAAGASDVGDGKDEKPRSKKTKRSKKPKKSDEPTCEDDQPQSKLKKLNQSGNAFKQDKLAEPQRSDIQQGYDKGPFTENEKRIADQVFADQCRTRGLDAIELKALMIDWLNMSNEIKVAFQEALPRRNKMAMRRFCQRRYHVHTVGAWTPDDDQVLRSAYLDYPDQWILISEYLDRRAGDCRDRWRNHLMFEKTMELGPWSEDEESMLVNAVEDCIQAFMEKAGKKDKELLHDRERLEEMLNWKVVAEKMSGKRNPKRCKEKWEKLKRREAINKAADGTQNPATLPTGITEADRSLRLSRMERKYQRIGVGDLHDILAEVHTAIDDHNKVYHHESTFWSVVAVKNRRSRFNSALRRRAYYDGLAEYTEADRSGTIAATALALAKELEKLWSKEDLLAKRLYRPEMTAMAAKEPKTENRKAGVKKEVVYPKIVTASLPKLMSTTKVLSEEFVLNSDVDADEDYANAQDAEQSQHPPVGVLTDESITTDEEDDGSEIPMEHAGLMPAPPSEPEVIDQMDMSSVNSRFTASPSPALNPRRFIERCRTAGRRQHAYQSRRTR